jgi:hypothetical protein
MFSPIIAKGEHMTFANYSPLAYERKKYTLRAKLFWVKARLAFGGRAPKPPSPFSGQVLDRARRDEAQAKLNDSLLARHADLIAALGLLESTRQALFGLEKF